MEDLTWIPATLAPLNADCGIGDAVLRELARLLDSLAQDPTFAQTIDLHSLPLEDADRERLRQRLGNGEVQATFDLAGPTRVCETAYAGVWWVRHADLDDHTLLEQIVVACCPDLLKAHPADIVDAARRLADELVSKIHQETVHE